MADFIYNPAESIRQGFQQAQSGLGSIFAQVIAQQQRDYNLAESAFQNIEALKKDVNIFGMKNITNKSNQLLGAASSAIRKDGSIDYEKIGQIRQSISEIKDLKTGYDLGAKELERRLQLGIANKDNMESFEKFYKDSMSVMADENLVKNPQDLMTKFSEVYSNNLSAAKMYTKSYLAANPYRPFSQDIMVDGNKVRVSGEIPMNMTIDDKGKMIPIAPKTTVVNGQSVTIDYLDEEVNRLKSTNPELLDLMKKQIGSPSQYMTDKDVVKTYMDKVPPKLVTQEIKDKNQLHVEEIAAKYAEPKAIADIAHTKAATTNAYTQNAINQMQLAGLKADQTSAQNSDEIYFASPRSMVMPLGKGATDVMGKSQKIYYDPATGALMVAALKSKSTGFNIAENQTGESVVANGIPYRKLDSFKKSVLASALTGIEATQKPIVKAQINRLFEKAKGAFVFPAFQAKLIAPNKIPAGEKHVTLSSIRALYNSGQFKSVNDGIAQAMSQGYKVSNQ